MFASWVFFRYTILDDIDEVVEPRSHFGVLSAVKALPAPYRVRDPMPEDVNNRLMEYRQQDIESESCALFTIGYQISIRVEHRYDDDNDIVELKESPANDLRLTNAILVPRLRVAAFKDGSGERLSANSGIGRLRAIIEYNSNHSMLYERTASHEDVISAMSRLKLTEFTFDIRPFNPHPSIPGEQLDELLKKNKVGHFRGKAQPVEGASMTSDAEGLISEAAGLVGKGYGQFGLVGETKSGAELKYQKPKFVGDRNKDIDQQEKPTNLRARIPVDDDKGTEQEYVVRTIKELFDE